MSPANQIRRAVMLTAWSSKRAEPARAFADCLCGAWAFIKRLATQSAKLGRRQGHVRLSRSLIRSPIQRATSTQRYAGLADFRAAFTTAALRR